MRTGIKTRTKEALRNLSPLNDSAESALALTTTFNTHLIRTEASYQELMQVGEAHKKKYGLQKEVGLVKDLLTVLELL